MERNCSTVILLVFIVILFFNGFLQESRKESTSSSGIHCFSNSKKFWCTDVSVIGAKKLNIAAKYSKSCL
jgi:hypothetical protein